MLNKISNANVLMDSFYKSRKNSIWKNSVQQYEANFLKNIRKTQIELRKRTYKQSPFDCFYLNERGKERYVRSISFYDRVVQRALCDQLTPIVEPYLIYDNGASIKNKGIDFARRRIENHLHSYYRKYGNIGYALTIDFSKFYDNILHKPLIEMYKEIIDDDDILKLIEHLVDSFSIDVSNYNMEELKQLLEDIIKICDKLGIFINRKKTQIFRLDKGFTFLKIRYRLTETGHLVRIPVKSGFVRERRKLKSFKKMLDDGKMTYREIEEQYKSWKGNIKRYDCHKALMNMDKLFAELFKNNSQNSH